MNEADLAMEWLLHSLPWPPLQCWSATDYECCRNASHPTTHSTHKLPHQIIRYNG